MTALGTEIAKFRAAWHALPEDQRIVHEEKLRQASLMFKEVVCAVPDDVGDAFMEVIGLGAIKLGACVGDRETMLKRAVAEGFPELWGAIEPFMDMARERGLLGGE